MIWEAKVSKGIYLTGAAAPSSSCPKKSEQYTNALRKEPWLQAADLDDGINITALPRIETLKFRR